MNKGRAEKENMRKETVQFDYALIKVKETVNVEHFPPSVRLGKINEKNICAATSKKTIYLAKEHFKLRNRVKNSQFDNFNIIFFNRVHFIVDIRNSELSVFGFFKSSILS